MAVATLGLFVQGLLVTIQDNNDGSPTTNFWMWLMPFVWLIIGMTAAAILWLLANIDQRLARIEGKS